MEKQIVTRSASLDPFVEATKKPGFLEAEARHHRRRSNSIGTKPVQDILHLEDDLSLPSPPSQPAIALPAMTSTSEEELKKNLKKKREKRKRRHSMRTNEVELDSIQQTTTSGTPSSNQTNIAAKLNLINATNLLNNDSSMIPSARYPDRNKDIIDQDEIRANTNKMKPQARSLGVSQAGTTVKKNSDKPPINRSLKKNHQSEVNLIDLVQQSASVSSLASDIDHLKSKRRKSTKALQQSAINPGSLDSHKRTSKTSRSSRKTIPGPLHSAGNGDTTDLPVVHHTHHHSDDSDIIS